MGAEKPCLGSRATGAGVDQATGAEIFGPQMRHLLPAGNPEGQLHDPVVEQRAAHFETVLHRVRSTFTSTSLGR
jgi:hypothetical protein